MRLFGAEILALVHVQAVWCWYWAQAFFMLVVDDGVFYAGLLGC